MARYVSSPIRSKCQYNSIGFRPRKHPSELTFVQGSSAAIKVPARSQYKEPMRSTCEGCGVVFKVSETDTLEDGKQTQFEYAINNGIIYYDISFVNCASGQSADNCPGHDSGLGIDSPNVRIQ